MNPIDSRTQAALDAAFGHVASTAAAAAERATEMLGTMATSATRIEQRDAHLSALSDLRHRMPAFRRAFNEALRERLEREIAAHGDKSLRLAEARWDTLSLVDDDELEERMLSDRIGQAITNECELELHDMAAYVGALLRAGGAGQERNPFHPESVGTAVFRAIEAVSTERETRKLLAREITPVMAKAMRICYAEILSDLKARGVQPVSLTVRGVEGPGSDRVVSGYAGLARGDGTPANTHAGEFEASSLGLPLGSGLDSYHGASSSRGAGLGGGTPDSQRSTGSGSLGRFADSGRGGSGTRSGASRLGAIPGASSAQALADAELMSLIRRLTFMTSRPGALDAASQHAASPIDVAQAEGPAPSTRGGSITGSLGTATGADRLGGGTGGLRGDGLTGLMAVNLIRAYRDELRQASSGTLDHMVIDIVGSLFDQILSDNRVPPQMARQIARLQLPVLRVALADPSFFSSRRHPVRRFVNRIASLACAFDDFDTGAGQQLLARVRELVQEIIEGDFDQVDVYAAKLTLLESFIEQQNENDVQAHGEAASLLEGKESELRVQQRYVHQLQTTLAPLVPQEYLRDFLAQVWSQALALAVRRDGATAERTQRLRRAATELVMSIQPKGTPALRKAFLMQLPGLMKTLNEGLALIGWPEAAQKDFFAKLLPAHAASLNGQPLSELDRNMLVKQLDAAFNAALPRSDPLLSHEAAALAAATPIEPQFSADEVQRLGLVKETAVDWDGKVDIDIDVGDEAADSAAGSSVPALLDPALAIDIDLDRLAPEPSEPAEPTHGLELMDHLRVGFAYQMHLKDGWKKVRLSYVSQGRSFFAFTHGRSYQETMSFTARMLARMCDTGRIRAVENSYLLERATARARKQLAALKPAAGSSTAH